MSRAKLDKQTKNLEKKIISGWMRITKEYRDGTLTEQEKTQFEKARLAEKQAQKAHFILGGPITKGF